MRPALDRRQLLGGGALLLGGYALAHLWGHRPLGAVESPFLGSSARTTLGAVFEALGPPGADVQPIVDGVDAFLGRGDPVVGEQLRLALGVLEHLGGAGPIGFSRFSRLDVDARRDVLESWRTSRIATKRQIADALRRVVLFTWYSLPSSWPAIGYDGPWVGR
ncbi:MAG: hypothetical protein H6737_05060 [Alphaproteobacteria bacterium]|nr:hypothetical protein [Alphaproteobacteria bacterium]